MVAEARDIGADRIGGLDDHLAPARLDRLAVDFDVYDVIAHRQAASPGAASTMLRPLLRTMYSNSWR